MKKFTFVIIDDNQENALRTKAIAESFQSLHFLAIADNYDDGLDVVLEHYPDIVFLEIDPRSTASKLSLQFINELHRFLTVIPKIFITTTNDALCLEALKYGVFDYFLNPIETKELRKSLFRLEKENDVLPVQASTSQFIPNVLPVNTVLPIDNQESVVETVVNNSELIATEYDSKTNKETNQEILETVTEDIVIINPFPEQEISGDEIVSNEIISEPTESKTVSFIQSDNFKEKPLVICVKSYGDYRYIDAADICYLQADNNSTDIHLNTGEMITAFKTLKHFEGVLTHPFIRIHNSYIVNIDYVSRIHTGNAVCHIRNTTTKLPFSKSYKENIDAIIATIASGNYLEI